MNNRDFKAYCIGDDRPLITFFSRILPADMRTSFSDKILNSAEIIAMNGEKCTVSEKNNTLHITHPEIPVGITIHSAHRDFDWRKEHDCAYVFLLTGHTGNIDKFLELLLKNQVKPSILRHPFVQFAIVQMPDDHKNAATDIHNAEYEKQNAEQQIRSVLKQYALEHIVNIISIPDDGVLHPIQLFAGGNRTSCFGFSLFHQNAKEACDSIAEQFQLNYKVQMPLGFAEDVIEDCFSWVTLNGTSNIQKKAAESFLSKRIWKEFLEQIVELYKEQIKEIAFWDIESDAADLRKEIILTAGVHLTGKEKPAAIPKSIKSQHDFVLFTIEKQFQTIRKNFSDRTRTLVTKVVPETVKLFLERNQSLYKYK